MIIKAWLEIGLGCEDPKKDFALKRWKHTTLTRKGEEGASTCVEQIKIVTCPTEKAEHLRTSLDTMIKIVSGIAALLTFALSVCPEAIDDDSYPQLIQF